MLRNLPETSVLDLKVLAILIIITIATIIGFLLNHFLTRILYISLRSFIAPEFGDVAQQLIEPHKKLIPIIIVLSILEVISVISPLQRFLPLVGFVFSLTLTITIGCLSCPIIRQFLNAYLVETATKNDQKASERIIYNKFRNNLLVIIIVTIFKNLRKLSFLRRFWDAQKLYSAALSNVIKLYYSILKRRNFYFRPIFQSV